MAAIGLALLNGGKLSCIPALKWSGLLFIIGTMLFSFSIYLSVSLDLPGLVSITPVGGMTIMAIAYGDARFSKEKAVRMILFISLILIYGVPAMAEDKITEMARNILGTKLQSCCTEPMTGFFRDGYCSTNQMDQGTHVVCAIVTDEFLEFTRSRGNDLSTPRPELQFPGLKAGDVWCLYKLKTLLNPLHGIWNALLVKLNIMMRAGQCSNLPIHP